MKIAVVVRQVPDLIEPLEVDASGTAFDLGSASFIVNESDDHALEQAILLKEAGGATVSVVALDFGDVDNTLYTAAAKGADRIIKIPLADGDAAAAQGRGRLVCRSHQAACSRTSCWWAFRPTTSWMAASAPFLAAALGLPYVGRHLRRQGGRRAGHGQRLQGIPRRRHGPAERQVAGRAGDPGRGATAALRSGGPDSRGDEDPRSSRSRRPPPRRRSRRGLDLPAVSARLGQPCRDARRLGGRSRRPHR